MNRAPKLASADLCTGCTACKSACSVGAIRMGPDGNGFLHPVVAAEKCINCGACERACPVLAVSVKRKQPLVCYASKSTNDEIRINSSSGGVFYELALSVLKRGGCVFGCVIEPRTLRIHHAKGETVEEVSAMRGSKYVQSDLCDTFSEVLKELQTGRLVLFTGTSCQIAGLKSFLIGEFDNLITMGVICHGVPSWKTFRRYIDEEENGVGSNVNEISFRHKKNGMGWDLNVVLYFENKKKVAYKDAGRTNNYMRAFVNGLNFRSSCYACRARNGNVGVDILVGDFWGIDCMRRGFNDGNGVSAVLLYSEKGRRCFEDLKMDTMVVRYNQIARFNHNLKYDTKRHCNRERFYAELESYSFSQLVERHVRDTWGIESVRMISKILKDLIRFCLPMKLRRKICDLRYR